MSLASAGPDDANAPLLDFEIPDGYRDWRLISVAQEGNLKVFGRQQSLVAGDATNIQFMIKDSAKYAATGGWGFAQFNDGKSVDAIGLSGCFGCHLPVKARDFVFTRYAP
jgi:hypothetical protein